MFNINKNERKETMSEVEKRTLPVEACVARNRQGLNGKNCYSQVEGYMTVDYINDEPVAFSLCPSRKIPKGFEDYYVSEKIDSFPLKLFSVFSKHLRSDTKIERNGVALMYRKSFLKKLAEARAIDSDRIRNNWVEVL